MLQIRYGGQAKVAAKVRAKRDSEPELYGELDSDENVKKDILLVCLTHERELLALEDPGEGRIVSDPKLFAVCILHFVMRMSERWFKIMVQEVLWKLPITDGTLSLT
jgi:hypothetical protein